MTRPETGQRFALFASGARLSVRVLEGLQEAGRLPALLVMPGYPPAPRPDAIDVARPESAFEQLPGEIPRIYLVRDAQAACAARLRRAAIDFLLVACWPWLITPELYQSPRKAALNLHPSLLPRDRGPDPLGAQLARGDSRFGVSLHRLDADFDSGDIVAQADFELAPRHRDRARLESVCAARGVRLFIDAMDTYPGGWHERAQRELSN